MRDQVVTLQQRRGRVTFRALKRQFDLDDDYVEDLKAEQIDARQVVICLHQALDIAHQQQSKVLELWAGMDLSLP